MVSIIHESCPGKKHSDSEPNKGQTSNWKMGIFGISVLHMPFPESSSFSFTFEKVSNISKPSVGVGLPLRFV